MFCVEFIVIFALELATVFEAAYAFEDELDDWLATEEIDDPYN